MMNLALTFKEDSLEMYNALNKLTREMSEKFTLEQLFSTTEIEELDNTGIVKLIESMDPVDNPLTEIEKYIHASASHMPDIEASVSNAFQTNLHLKNYGWEKDSNTNIYTKHGNRLIISNTKTLTDDLINAISNIGITNLSVYLNVNIG